MSMIETLRNMSWRQELAIFTASAVSFGTWGVVTSLDERADSRAAAITSQACYDSYVSRESGDTITQDTIDCMKNGWVPGSDSINTSRFYEGTSAALLTGYIALEKTKGGHFDVAKPLYRALIGGPIGVLISLAIVEISVEDGQRKPSREGSDEKQGQEPPKDDKPTTGLWTGDKA